MNDKELLELAAKAIGFTYEWGRVWDGESRYNWEPLVSANDAMDLMVKLQLDILFYEDQVECIANTGNESLEPFAMVPYGDDKHAAVRMAIVMVAAEIGKKL